MAGMTETKQKLSTPETKVSFQVESSDRGLIPESN